MNVYKFILFLILFLAVFVFSLDVEKIAEYKKPFKDLNQNLFAELYSRANIRFSPENQKSSENTTDRAKFMETDKSIDYSTGYLDYHGQRQMVEIATRAPETYLSNKTSFRGVSSQGYQNSYGNIL